MVKFMPTFLAIPSIVSWMFWLNGLGTSGMRNMLLPRNVDGSMGSPGAVKVGSALYLATLSVTAAATALPLPELVVALPPLVSQPGQRRHQRHRSDDPQTHLPLPGGTNALHGGSSRFVGCPIFGHKPTVCWKASGRSSR